MNSFLAYTKKEFIEGLRTYKFLIIAVGFFFFAILNPVLLKVTPLILKAQMNMDLGSLIVQTQKASIESFIGDLFEMLPLIVTLTLMGILSGERKHKTLVIPYCSGAKFSGIIIAKNLVYILAIFSIVFPAFMADYYYSGIIFGSDYGNLAIIMKAALLCSLFFSFVVCLVTFFSSFFLKGVIPALLTLAIIYLLHVITGLFKISRFSPTSLITKAMNLDVLQTMDFNAAAIETLL